MSLLRRIFGGRTRETEPRPILGAPLPSPDGAPTDEWTYPPRYVQSSNIGMVAYSATRQIMKVWFRSGGVYEYDGIPVDMFSRFLAAKSKGSFLYWNIRGWYPYRKIG